MSTQVILPCEATPSNGLVSAPLTESRLQSTQFIVQLALGKLNSMQRILESANDRLLKPECLRIAPGAITNIKKFVADEKSLVGSRVDFSELESALCGVEHQVNFLTSGNLGQARFAYRPGTNVLLMLPPHLKA